MKYRTKKAMLAGALVAALGIGTASYLMRPAQDAMKLISSKKTAVKPQANSSVAAGTPPNSNSRSSVVSAALAAASNKSSSNTSSTAAAAANATQVNYNLSDGQYAGNRVYAFYGYVRVEAVIQNGQIRNVRVLEHPNDNGTSRYINSVAMPYLVQEAVQAQNANVSLISGATLSSEAFVKSLYSALQRAAS